MSVFTIQLNTQNEVLYRTSYKIQHACITFYHILYMFYFKCRLTHLLLTISPTNSLPIKLTHSQAHTQSNSLTIKPNHAQFHSLTQNFNYSLRISLTQLKYYSQHHNPIYLLTISFTISLSVPLLLCPYVQFIFVSLLKKHYNLFSIYCSIFVLQEINA